MNFRRLLGVACFLLVVFLAVYSWNRRAGILDDLASNIGLEITSLVLNPLRSLENTCSDFWTRYFELVNVREENIRLKKTLKDMEAKILASGEDLAELKRLRELVQLPIDARWQPIAARVLAGRIGPNAVLESIIISRGYLDGAKPGIPIVTQHGLIGRVLRASAHASIVLLITDPASHVAVLGQDSRSSGILKGDGMGKKMIVDFVRRDKPLKEGELLVTSGLDNKYPRGLPVARVSNVVPSNYTQFMDVKANTLLDLQRLEEVLLLEKSDLELPTNTIDKPVFYPIGTTPETFTPSQSQLANESDQPLKTDVEKEEISTNKRKNATEAQYIAPKVPRLLPPMQSTMENEEIENSTGDVSKSQTSESPNVKPQVPSMGDNTIAPPGSLRNLNPENIPKNAEGAPRYKVIVP